MHIRKLLIAAGVTLAALLTAGMVAAQSEAERSTGGAAISLEQCVFKWKDARVISSRIPGTIAEILVQEGDEVDADQVLARLDDRIAKIEYEIQKLIGDSDLAIRVQEDKLAEYKARLDSADTLYKNRAMSKEDYRLAVVNVRVNQTLLLQEVEKQKTEQLKSDRALETLKDHTVTSPIKGVVQKVARREQESLSPNEAGQGPQSLQGLQLFRIVASDKLWVEGFAEQLYLYRIRPGQRVQVQINLDVPEAREMFEGKVVFVDPEIQAGNGTFMVRAEVENRASLLKAGLRGTMRILPDDSAAADARRRTR